jgi:hypothetical protein
MENILKTIATETLISGVYNYFLWEHLYTLHDITLINIKRVMKNHIQAEEANMTKQG